MHSSALIGEFHRESESVAILRDKNDKIAHQGNFVRKNQIMKKWVFWANSIHLLFSVVYATLVFLNLVDIDWLTNTEFDCLVKMCLFFDRNEN